MKIFQSPGPKAVRLIEPGHLPLDPPRRERAVEVEVREDHHRRLRRLRGLQLLDEALRVSAPGEIHLAHDALGPEEPIGAGHPIGREVGVEIEPYQRRERRGRVGTSCDTHAPSGETQGAREPRGQRLEAG